MPEIAPVISSRAFETSGFYVMASEKLRTKLTVHAGPMGALRAGHSHCDLLALHLAIDGRECLADPGTFRYIPDFGERDAFRGTTAHNTLKIGHSEQAESGGPFAWNAPPSVRIQNWIAGKSFDLLVADHSGYQRLNPPALHRRSIFSLKSKFWLIRDEVEGTGHHQLGLFWHLAPALAWRNALRGSFFAENNLDGEALLTLITEYSNKWIPEIREGSYSPAYGRKEGISLLGLKKQAALPEEFLTVLFPGRADSATLTGLEMTTANNHVKGYRCEASGENHYLFFSQTSVPWKWQTWSSDATFLYLSLGSNRELSQFILCGGTFLEIDGRRVFESPKPVTSYEWPAPIALKQGNRIS
jgi:hypothetical protein